MSIRRSAMWIILGAVALAPSGKMRAQAAEAEGRPPNIIIVFTDDMGYGDLGSYGHPTIHTPHLDRMAAEGQRWTSFYSAASVCTPSRAALLTGRLPVRNGMASDRRRVLFPDSKGGLPRSEITIARALQEVGYATACIGKWHLGHLEEFLPTSHGFDYYFGIPYSNDMDNVSGIGHFQANYPEPEVEYFNVPLMRNTQIIERPADQTTLTRRYTEEVVGKIEEYRDQPFFIYYPQTFPHVPLFVSEDFRGRSEGGLYGDVIEEIDWSVGQIREALDRLGLAHNTLVVFTSDNGPWLPFREHGGLAGPLRDGKGTTWEGGMRVPAIFWWPGKIEPAVIREIGCTLDLFNTALSIAGLDIPEDRTIDGYDLSPTLFGSGEHPRDEMLYYRGTQLYAVRQGPWKAHFVTQGAYQGGAARQQHDPPQLFHLGHDVPERFNRSDEFPEVIERIKTLAAEHRTTVVDVESQLEKR
jgi:arylsulfatase A